MKLSSFLHNGQRIALPIIGGYFLAAVTVSLLATLLTLLMPRGEAVTLSMICGFLFYLGFLLWGFAQRNLTRLWMVLVAGPAAGFLLRYLYIIMVN